MKNQFTVKASYNQKKDQTAIQISRKGEKKQKQTLPGFVIIKLDTKSGKLGYEF